MCYSVTGGHVNSSFRIVGRCHRLERTLQDVFGEPRRPYCLRDERVQATVVAYLHWKEDDKEQDRFIRQLPDRP